MRPDSEFNLAHRLIRSGLNNCEISRDTRIPLSTVWRWRREGRHGDSRRRADARCPRCGGAELEGPAYAYLLGLYLGDGCLVRYPRGVFRLEVSLDSRYPGIIEECSEAMSRARAGGSVGQAIREGCTTAYAYWKHWPCLFPQHGPGRKHERPIVLDRWQAEVVARPPDRLLRGLIHSDGWRDVNRVNGKAYPRYQFTNVSADIREIFCCACDLYGIRWRRTKWNTISVARAHDVAKLDEVIGPKQ